MNIKSSTTGECSSLFIGWASHNTPGLRVLLGDEISTVCAKWWRKGGKRGVFIFINQYIIPNIQFHIIGVFTGCNMLVLMLVQLYSKSIFRT